MVEPTYTVKALNESTWAAFAALVERNNGVFGGCWCMGFHPKGEGWGKSAELIYTGDIIDAQEAFRCGFLQKLVPVPELDATVEKLVSSILLGGPRAIRLQKALMRDWQRMSITDGIWQGIRACVAARETDEPRRMMEAFMNRRRK